MFHAIEHQAAGSPSPRSSYHFLNHWGERDMTDFFSTQEWRNNWKVQAFKADLHSAQFSNLASPHWKFLKEGWGQCNAHIMCHSVVLACCGNRGLMSFAWSCTVSIIVGRQMMGKTVNHWITIFFSPHWKWTKFSDEKHNGAEIRKETTMKKNRESRAWHSKMSTFWWIY